MLEPTIFLSYARADKATAASVVESLKAAGLTVWWDADIPLGRTWQEQLQARLSDCTAFLVLIGESPAHCSHQERLTCATNEPCGNLSA